MSDSPALDLSEFITLDPDKPAGIWIADLYDLSPRTIESYNQTAVQLYDYLLDEGHPTVVTEIRRDHIAGYIADVYDQHSPSTAGLRYRSLSVLFKYLLREQYISENPMATLKHPKQEKKVVPVVSPADLTALVKACAGTDFLDRRDMALIMFMVDTGVRVGEVVALTPDDFNFAAREVLIRGKGSRQRILRIGPRAFSALLKYRAMRGHHPQANQTTRWWISNRGPITTSGVTQILKRRSAMAGIERVRPHALRHTYAHAYLASGGAEGNLMQDAGWSSRTMLDRYGASAAGERAREAHDRHSPLEQLDL